MGPPSRLEVLETIEGEGDLCSLAGELLARVRYRIEVKRWVYREERIGPRKRAEPHASGFLKRLDGGHLTDREHLGRVLLGLEDGRTWDCRVRGDGYALGAAPSKG